MRQNRMFRWTDPEEVRGTRFSDHERGCERTLGSDPRRGRPVLKRSEKPGRREGRSVGHTRSRSRHEKPKTQIPDTGRAIGKQGRYWLSEYQSGTRWSEATSSRGVRTIIRKVRKMERFGWRTWSKSIEDQVREIGARRSKPRDEVRRGKARSAALGCQAPLSSRNRRRRRKASMATE